VTEPNVNLARSNPTLEKAHISIGSTFLYVIDFAPPPPKKKRYTNIHKGSVLKAIGLDDHA